MRGRGAYPWHVSAPAATARLQQQLPNALTLARLVAIPIFAVLLLTSDGGRSWAAAIVFGAAGATDQIEVNTLGKVATWLLYASLGFTMVTDKGTVWPRVIFWIGFALALAALAAYLWKARREVRP